MKKTKRIAKRKEKRSRNEKRRDADMLETRIHGRLDQRRVRASTRVDTEDEDHLAFLLLALLEVATMSI